MDEVIANREDIIDLTITNFKLGNTPNLNMRASVFFWNANETIYFLFFFTFQLHQLLAFYSSFTDGLLQTV